jgi:hypothetical protein
VNPQRLQRPRGGRSDAAALRDGSPVAGRDVSPFPNIDLRMILVAFVALRLVAVVIGIAALGERPVVDDYVARFHEIANQSGRAYVDVDVEYLPGQWLVIELLGGSDEEATGVAIILAAFAADLVTAALIGSTWGRGAAAWYLMLGAPLLLFSYGGFEFLSTALAVGAMALLARGRGRAGGALLALATLTRGWPLVLLPYLIARRSKPAIGWFVSTFVVGFVAWIWSTDPTAIAQVVTFRGARGWEFESVIGTVAWVVGAPPSHGSGASRFGSAPTWAMAVLAVTAVVIVVAVWMRAHRRGAELGRPAAASLGTSLLLAPLFSFPFVAWLTPWSAIAARERDGTAVARLCAATTVLTLVAVLSFGTKESFPLLTQGLLLARDVALGLLVLRSVR